MLAMMAVLLRCAIAPGLMLDPLAAARGELKLVICTPAGAKSIAPSSDHAPGPDRRSDGELCSYAAPGHPGALAAPVALGSERLRPAYEASPREAPRRAAFIRNFAARAPPIAA